MRRAIVCTGLVRSPVKFNAFLDVIASLDASTRDDLTVMFSTWVNELNAYPEIRARLKALNCIVIEQGEPDLTLAGHALHQLVSISVAAELLDDSTFVLKFRPDIGHVRDVALFLRSQPEPVSEAAPLSSLVRHRFQHRGAFGAQPLYINDVTYCSMATDLRKLTRLPFSFLTNYVRVAPEQLYWGAPFISELPVLDAYFRVNFGLIFNNIEQSRILRAILIESPLYARALAVYTLIMRDYFVYFDADTNEAELQLFLANHTLEDILWHNDPGPDIRHHPTAHTNYFHSNCIWPYLAEGRFKMSKFGALYLTAMAEYHRADGLAFMQGQRMMLHAEAAEMGDRLEKALPAGPLRQIRPSEGGYVIQSRQYEWSLARGDRDHLGKLEQTNNALRRQIDQLVRRIRDVPTDKSATSVDPTEGS